MYLVVDKIWLVGESCCFIDLIIWSICGVKGSGLLNDVFVLCKLSASFIYYTWLLHGSVCYMDVVVTWMWLFCWCGCFVDVVVSWMWLFRGCGCFVDVVVSLMWLFRGCGCFVDVVVSLLWLFSWSDWPNYADVLLARKIFCALWCSPRLTKLQ